MTSPRQILEVRIGCDGCTARAVFYIRFSFGALYLCGHHWNRHETRIVSHPNYLDAAELVGRLS